MNVFKFTYFFGGATMGYTRWKYETLVKLCNDAFRKFGFNGEDSGVITDVLLLSDLYGIESHGMQRMARYYKAGGGLRDSRLCGNRRP